MTVGPSAGPRLDADEVRQLAILLARYAEHDLDQFDLWRVVTPNLTAYVEISLRPRPDVPAELFTTIWPEVDG